MARTFPVGVAALALLIAPPRLALAQEVDAVVVTATRAQGGIAAAQVGSALTVVTPQEMQDRQVRIVSDVLRDVPGVAVSRSGGVGGLTQVRLRGTESNHVLTLIDGIEADDPFAGEFDYGALLADEVARIEILRGPQSALYGSDAIGGVINYITPTGREAPGGSVRVEAGSQATFGGAARYAGVNGPLDYVLGAGVQRTEGFVGQTLPGGSRKLGSELQSFSAKANYQLTGDLVLHGLLRFTDTRAETDDSTDGLGQVDTPGAYFDVQSLYYSLGGDLKSGRWTHSLSLQGVDADRNGYDPTGRSSGDLGRRIKASYVASFRIEDGALTHTLTGAVDWRKETYQNTSPPSAGADMTRRSVENTGLVGQYDLQVGDRAGLDLAVRHDDNAVFADATTWKAQGYVRLNGRLRLRAAAGTGIKDPSQTELFGYNATGPFPFQGNPDLKPERSKSWEAGGDLSLWAGRLDLAATYFEARLKDEIFSYFGGPAPSGCLVPPAGVSTSCNRVADSTQKGVELSGTARLAANLTLAASYTDLDAREAGREEIRRAPHIASVNLTWKPLAGRATVNLNVRYNGAQLDTNFTGIAPPFPASSPKVRPASGEAPDRLVLPAFTLVNLDLSYDVDGHVEIFARGENLTGANYYEVFGFPAQPRAVYAGARVRF